MSDIYRMLEYSHISIFYEIARFLTIEHTYIQTAAAANWLQCNIPEVSFDWL